MRATSIKSDETRIIPASGHKAVLATKSQNGSMKFDLANGSKIETDDIDMQAFVVWTMLNSDCTK